MATVTETFDVAAPPDFVWAAIRAVDAVHTRLVPGLVTSVSMGEEERIVTFANGVRLRELIVDIDDTSRRLAYASVGGPSRHHNASMQVGAVGSGSRVVWITDVLPHERAAAIRNIVATAAPLMKQTLESAFASAQRDGNR